MTSAQAAPLRIAHVSDLHVGAAREEQLRSLVADVRHASVAATVITGDLTSRARSREFRSARRVVASFPGPTLCLIGNHDVPLLNPLRRASSPYRAFREQISADLDPVLDLPTARIQGLGSMPRWRWKSGRISQRQSQLVTATFADAPPGIARLVAMHHPPSAGGLASLAGGGDFARALVDAEVDIVLAGHTHVPAETVLTLSSGECKRSVVQVVAGTASTRTRGVARSWSLLEVTADELTVTRRHAQASTWRDTARATFRLPAHGHRSRGEAADRE